MAYSDVWDETYPNGATFAAADIDVAFHKVWTELRERLNTMMGFSIATALADPVINGSTTKSLNALTTLATGYTASIAVLNGLVNTPFATSNQSLTSNTPFNIGVSDVNGGWYLVTIFFTAGSGITSLQASDLTTPSADGGTSTQKYDNAIVANATYCAMVRLAAAVSPGFAITAQFGGGSNTAIISYKKLGPLV